MTVDNQPTNPLEDLRQIINSSIDVVQEYLARENYPPLNLNVRERHPIRDKYDESAIRALKCISNAGVMLRALCDPDAFMHDVMFNFNDHTALFVASQADLANVIGEKNCSLSDMAETTGIEADKLARFLRALCNMHIFREVAPDVFANNELSFVLRSESKRALVGLNAEECRLASCKAWEALNRPDYRGSTDKGKTAFNIAYQTDLSPYEYWENIRPDLGARGAKAFAGKGFNSEQYLSLYPWAQEQNEALIVDVGGGAGGATLPIVAKYPNLRLEVQDRSENENSFYKHLERTHPDIAHTKRATFCGQDFFDVQATKDADVYYLRHVLHNWPDEMASKILSNISCSMSPTSKVLVCEHVLSPTYRPSQDQEDGHQAAPEPLLPNWGGSFTSRLDLVMLACLNSKQRTEQGFRDLAATAGLVVKRVWRNMGDEAIFECHLKTV